MSFRQLIPDPQVSLFLAPEDLDSQLLQAATLRVQNSMFDRDEISRFAGVYPQQYQAGVEIAISEAWRWLEIHVSTQIGVIHS